MWENSTLLNTVPLFQSLTEEERAELSLLLKRVHFNEGELVFRYGDPGDTLYIIVSGAIKFFHTDPTGGERLLEEAGQGSFFGEVAILSGETRAASARVTRDMIALELQRKDLNEFLMSHPASAMALLSEIAGRLRRSGDQLRKIPVQSARERSVQHESPFDHRIRAAAKFCASLKFLLANVIFYVGWICINESPQLRHFDPPPFSALSVMIAIETVGITTIVLNNQKRQDELDDQRETLIHEDYEKMISELHTKMDELRKDVLLRRHAEPPQHKPGLRH